MTPPMTSERLAELFRMESLILRKDLQQDKKAALNSVVQMFKDFGVPYAVTGGLAAQLYTDQPRMTMDVDIVSLRKPFQGLKEAQPWSRYGLELVFDRRRFIKLKHLASNVEVDINVSLVCSTSPRLKWLTARRSPLCRPWALPLPNCEHKDRIGRAIRPSASRIART